MKIVVLDGNALNPGDLSWDCLNPFGSVTVYGRTGSALAAQRIGDAEIVLTNKTPITEELLSACPNVRLICVLATGYNVVDIESAKKKGIVVTNIPAYSTQSVAQMVFAHILNITQRVGHYACMNRQGKWSDNADFCYWDTDLIELDGKWMGIVGYGNIGQATARIALAFGMKVGVYTSKAQSELPESVVKMELDDLFKNCDIVSLHCPLTSSTQEMVNAERLNLMKSNAILINTGRGPLINEQDLADALNEGKIMAAGLDVLSSEPPLSTNPLLSARNCFITPHIAWATKEARIRLMQIAVNNLKEYMNGNVINNVAK